MTDRLASSMPKLFPAPLCSHTSRTVVVPLSTCIVDEKPLASKGGPVDLQREGRLVRCCSEECASRFKKEPGAYLERLDQAVVVAVVGISRWFR